MPLRPVPGERESVRFVAQLLNQIQRRMMLAGSLSGVLAPLKIQSFPSGMPPRTLGNADQPHPSRAKLVDCRRGGAELTATAIDEKHVRHGCLGPGQARAPSRQGLGQRRIVVPGGDAGDIEPPVLRLQRPLGTENHA